MTATLTATEHKLAKYVVDRIHYLRQFNKVGKNGQDYTGKGSGIHSVYSKFNDIFTLDNPGQDVKEVTALLAGKGIIRMRFARGGVMLFDASEPQPVKVRKPSTSLLALKAQIDKALSKSK